MTTLRLGTRGSKLALTQSELVASLIRDRHPDISVELVSIATAGDRDQTTALTAGEGAGWFTTAIQQAIVAREVDLAVHSYKDLPTKRPEGLVIAAVPLREDPRDALVTNTGHTLHDLPRGTVVGTSSPRREAQVREVRPDLEVRSIRGNVETRIGKVDSGEFGAAVLALAGLKRLGLESRASHVFGYEEMLPAPAQGALAVECRSDDTATREIVASIDDPDLRLVVTAERVFLATIDGGCSFPAAAYAERFGTTLKLHGLVAAGGRIIRSKMAGPRETAGGLGRSLANELMANAGMR